MYFINSILYDGLSGIKAKYVGVRSEEAKVVNAAQFVHEYNDGSHMHESTV